MGGKLSKSQATKAKEVFNKHYDENGDGRINKEELKKAMIEMGENPTDAEVDMIFSGVDADGNGTIETKEFLAHMQQRMEEFKNVEELKEAFKQHDRNNDGYISRLDFDIWIKGLMSGRSNFRRALDELIFDEDGKLNFEEYCAMMATYSLGDEEMEDIAALGEENVKEMSECGISLLGDQNRTKALS